MHETRPANSVGIWAFGPSPTRFVPSGYHPEAALESMVEKTKRVADGLADLVDGLEYHYPGEVNEDRIAPFKWHGAASRRIRPSYRSHIRDGFAD